MTSGASRLTPLRRSLTPTRRTMRAPKQRTRAGRATIAPNSTESKIHGGVTPASFLIYENGDAFINYEKIIIIDFSYIYSYYSRTYEHRNYAVGGQDLDC